MPGVRRRGSTVRRGLAELRPRPVAPCPAEAPVTLVLAAAPAVRNYPVDRHVLRVDRKAGCSMDPDLGKRDGEEKETA